MVNVTMIMPSRYESRLSKVALRSKDIKLYGASWDAARFICECGYTFGGVPSYVRKLEDRIKELELQVLTKS